MRTQTLGRTGIEVGIVGLGAAWLGHPRGARQIDEPLGAATVHAALEAGCTLIDTAQLYGGGVSERIIGRALRERPDLAQRAVVTTKCGRQPRGYNYEADAVRRSIEESLEKLGMERIEIVFIHDAMGVPKEQVLGEQYALGALRRLQKEGIVRHVGCALNDPDPNAEYIATGEFDAAVVPEAWSLLNQYAEERILPAAEKHHVGLICATPLERGILATGPLEGEDYMARDFSERCIEQVRAIQRLCERYEIPLAAASLQWCVRRAPFAAAIPGARTPEEARSNGLAGQAAVPDDFWDDLEPLIQHFEAGVDR